MRHSFHPAPAIVNLWPFFDRAVIWRWRHNPPRKAALSGYRRIVEQSRLPAFFTGCAVPDTLDGRFELICLHAFLCLHRLKARGREADRFSQELFDTMFADMDRSLREMGKSDLRVGREIKRMAEGFYGRVRAYEEGLAGADAVLAAALARNLFGTATGALPLAEMAAYVRRAAARLDAEPLAELLAGHVEFGPPPEAASAAREAVP